MTTQCEFGTYDDFLLELLPGGVHAYGAVQTVAVTERDRVEFELVCTGGQFLGMRGAIEERKTRTSE